MFLNDVQSIHIMLFKPESVQGLFRNSAFSFFALQFFSPKLIKTVHFTENITDCLQKIVTCVKMSLTLR